MAVKWDPANGSTEVVQTAVRLHVEAVLLLMPSDFISTPLPVGLQDDATIDVIVMDFALDDFRACHDRGP